MSDLSEAGIDFVGAHGRAPLRDNPLANYQRWTVWLVMALLGLIILAALPVAAQEVTQPITFDMINKIARELYCPVCPNETLDACQTQACIQWRSEIHDQLAAGQSEKEIIDSFVRRYGQRVIGTPDDPALRTLSLATPFVIAGLALIVGVFTFTRWRRRPQLEVSPAKSTPLDDSYRDQLERDLNE